MPTLIDSSRNYAHIKVLSYTTESIDEAVNRFIDRIFAEKRKLASDRLVIANGRYMYTPSNEYTQEKSRFIRAKFHRL